MNRRTSLQMGLVLIVVLTIYFPNGLGNQKASAAPDAWEVWTQECPDCLPHFSNMSDRSLRLDSSGHPHIAYGSRYLYYAWYDGMSWHKTVVDPADGVGSLASLALDVNGYAHISYVDRTSALKYAFEDITGWHTQVVDDHADHFAFSSIALNPSGDARIAYYHYDDITPSTWDGELIYAHLEASGWITQTVDSPDNVGYTLSMAVDTSGYPHISYLDNTHSDLKYAYQDLSGWHAETVDSTGYAGLYSSIAIDDGGYPHISYYQSTDPGFPENLNYAYKDISGWHIQTISAAYSTYPSNSSIALDSSGYPHISYYVWPELKYAYQDTLGWHTSSVDAGPNVGWYSSIALDNSGNAHISYFDYSNWPSQNDGPHGKLWYTHQDNGGWTKTMIDEEGDVGNYLSLKIDGMGNPRISYYDNTNDDLKFAHRDGSGWHTETVDSTGDVGRYTSLALGSDGYAHISYYDGSNADLKYAYQDSSGWHIQTLDSSGYVGSRSSIALDGAGYPHISYFDNTGINPLDLKYAYQDVSGWHFESVANAYTDRNPSLALDLLGYPHISYSGQSGLSYAFQDSTGWHYEAILYNQSIIDTQYISLALNSSGYGRIGFYLPGVWGNDLGYAYQDGTGWHLEILDETGDVGKYSSLGLDQGGYSYIAYYDDTNDHLKFAYQDTAGWHFKALLDEQPISLDAISLVLDDFGNPHLGYYAYKNLNYMYSIEPGTRIHLPMLLRQNP